MLGRKLKNSGMTLVEVLVSMLVLSIAAVTVISAFSMAAQVNTKAKRQQGAEALMENMLEYAEAGGADFKGWFLVDDDDYENLTPVVTPAPGATPTPQTIKIEELRNVKSGHLEYTVKITTDNAPAKYASDQLNNLKVIQFGSSGSNAILIDASDTSVENYVTSLYHSWHTLKVDQHDAEELALAEADEDYDPELWREAPYNLPKDETAVGALINREIHIKSEPIAGESEKFRLVAEMVYTVSDGLELPDGVDRTYSEQLCYSEKFDSEDSLATSPKHLTQIYLMFSDEDTGDSEGIDIRFWDPAGMLDVNLYAVKQATIDEDDPEDAAASADGAHDFSQYYSGGDICITCIAPGVGGIATPPNSAKIFSSLEVTGDVTSQTDIEIIGKELVARDDKVRAVTVTIEIIDEDTGKTVLTPETVTRLQ